MVCSCCNTIIGTYHQVYYGLHLYKWRIAVKNNDNAIWKQVPAQEIASAYLLDLIESCATRRFLAYSGIIKDATDGLLVSELHISLKNQDLMFLAMDFHARHEVFLLKLRRTSPAGG